MFDVSRECFDRALGGGFIKMVLTYVWRTFSAVSGYHQQCQDWVSHAWQSGSSPGCMLQQKPVNLVREGRAWRWQSTFTLVHVNMSYVWSHYKILRKIETPELKLFTLHDGADPLLKQTIRISDIRIYQNVSLVRPSERCHISLVRIPRTQKTAFENEGNVMWYYCDTFLKKKELLSWIKTNKVSWTVFKLTSCQTSQATAKSLVRLWSNLVAH